MVDNTTGTSIARFRSLIVDVLDMVVEVFDNTSDIYLNVDMLDPGSAWQDDGHLNCTLSPLVMDMLDKFKNVWQHDGHVIAYLVHCGHVRTVHWHDWQHARILGWIVSSLSVYMLHSLLNMFD